MTICLLELRHLIEVRFLPLECRCTSTIPNHLIIELMGKRPAKSPSELWH
ncbi:DUF1652 domain-containing protein [Pseudomonas yamanorum]